MNYDIILVRYGEMTLKKKNYKQFLKKINENIKRKCSVFPKLTYFNTDYRFYIYLNGENYENVINVLNTVVGLYSYSLCKYAQDNYDNISEIAIAMLKEKLNGQKATFKVETNRGNKSFPATSIQISQEVAKRILPNVEGLSVDVHNPMYTINIDLRCEGTYIYLNEIKGLGGYPSGTQGSGLLMMSGGLDSPVACYLAMRKGLNVYAIHYASPPYTSDNALQKVVDLLQVLAKYTSNDKIKLFVVPFTKIQQSIHENASPKYLVTLMRRAMYKIGEKVCLNKKIDVMINGESIGQVASQTLESMKVVNAVTCLPIIRPLATYDKEEIIAIARKIKTYDISIRPYEDCCTVFVPEHPVIKPSIEEALLEESKCNLDPLIEEAVINIETIELNDKDKYSVFKDKFDI
ncbi:probable tRNA sulfurtransferase [Coprobacillus sp. CAG:698]|nr:probable tRNA sulfurtransferase [Coprobacillus sp. CAG:698]